MKTALGTIIAAIILMGIVVVLLGIGWILTGKSRLRRGSCGSIPSKDKKDPSNTKTCSICGSEKICEEKKEEEKNDSNK